MTKFNSYRTEMYEEDFEFVSRMYINGEIALERATAEDIQDKIAEWEWKNGGETLYTEERAAEKAQGNGFTGNDYEMLQTEGHGYGEDAKDIPAWR